MAGLADNFLLNPLFRQPLLGSVREYSHDELFTPIAVAPSELDIRPFGLIVVLCLVKSKVHSFRPGCKNAKCPTRGVSGGIYLLARLVSAVTAQIAGRASPYDWLEALEHLQE